MKHQKATILDTTLRDGSYQINFAFSSVDTAIICKLLEEAGVQYIEVGHGVGMNASKAGFGQAAQTDEEYMVAARKAISKAKYGMFCIPGIARLEDLDIAAKHGMDFVRIGTNVDEIASSRKFIHKAKKLGMFVAANHMKSYALAPKEFARNVKLSESYGADLVYIVDSAGSMFPGEISEYVHAVRELTDIKLGFHAHDNLGMAVANSLIAIECGVEFVDGSLQGLGRSGGNAATELLVATLLRKGVAIGIDLLKVIEAGHKHIHPILPMAGRMPLDTVAGFAAFHSSYMGHIRRFAAEYQVDPAMLIIEVCKHDKINISESILKRAAAKLKKKEDLYLSTYGFNYYIGGEQDGRKK